MTPKTTIFEQRSGDDRRDDAGLPWQVRAIVMLGVPAAIALFLVYVIAIKQGEALPRIEQKIDSHIQATEAISSAIEKDAENDHRHEEKLEGYMRLLCVNAARTAPERNACLNVR